MKKFLKAVKNIFSWAITVLAVCIMIFTVVSSFTFNRNDRDIFGYKAFIVQTDSMSATDFSAGDLILTKYVVPSTLKEGDIITFQSQAAESYGEVITHKIRRLVTDAEGNPGFVTYGTTTNTDDETVVTYSFVLGKYQLHIPKVGSFFMFLKSTPGYITCIFIPFMILILMQGIRCVSLFRSYKREQIAEMDEERRKIEAERAENAAMMAELRSLQAQLRQQNAAVQAEVADAGAEAIEAEEITEAANTKKEAVEENS